MLTSHRMWQFVCIFRRQRDDVNTDDPDYSMGDDGDNDGVGEGDHSIRRNLTIRLATLMLASKLPQNLICLSAKASTNTGFYIYPKLWMENSTTSNARCSQKCSPAGFPSDSQAGSEAGSKEGS